MVGLVVELFDFEIGLVQLLSELEKKWGTEQPESRDTTTLNIITLPFTNAPLSRWYDDVTGRGGHLISSSHHSDGTCWWGGRRQNRRRRPFLPPLLFTLLLICVLPPITIGYKRSSLQDLLPSASAHTHSIGVVATERLIFFTGNTLVLKITVSGSGVNPEYLIRITLQPNPRLLNINQQTHPLSVPLFHCYATNALSYFEKF